MKTQSFPQERKVEDDPQLLFWFAIGLMSLVFIWSFFNKPDLLKPTLIIPYTLLFSAHIFLHFKINWLDKHRRWLAGYVIVQGLLAFGVTYLSSNTAMVFCLYMALIGELLGAFKVTVAGILLSVYLLSLAFVNFVLMVGLKQAGWFGLATIPTVVFVGIYVILYTRQADANLRAQELLAKLETANQQLSDYAAQVEDLTLTTERQRMARELHDTLSQGLAGLILQLEAVDAHLGSQRTERAREILKESMVKARGTLSEARQVIDNLRQPVEHTLLERIQRECAHFTNSTGIACEPEIDLEEGFPEAVADAAGKVIAESLTNIARHAQASHASVRLTEDNGTLELEVIDDGVGFDPKTIQDGHYGLLGMQERVHLAGGQLNILSEPGKGTGIRATFPLEGESHD